MPPLQSNSITLRVPPRRRVVLALIVVEQPTRIRRLLAREAQRKLERHTIPIRIGTRNLVAEHFALVAPIPDRDITHRVAAGKRSAARAWYSLLRWGCAQRDNSLPSAAPGAAADQSSRLNRPRLQKMLRSRFTTILQYRMNRI